MVWTIKYDPRTEKALRKAGPEQARRIIRFMRDRVAVLDDPRTLAKPLTGQFSQLWRYRVGDFRVICEVDEKSLVVLVIRIGHRKAVYR